MAINVPLHRSASLDESLLTCIECTRIVEQPLLLSCLHNCCTVCADRAATATQGLKAVSCAVCHVSTEVELMKHPNGFIAEQVRRFQALRDADKCTVCAEDGSPGELADVWCVQCQRSLCSACVPHHSRYNKSHKTIAMQQIGNWSEVLDAEGHQCSVHGKQLELLCFDCRLARCTECARLCESLGHAAPQLLKGPKGESLLADTRASIKRLQMLVLGKSMECVQSKDLVREVQSARAVLLDELKTRKKYVMDALSKTYEEAESVIKEMYDRLEESAAGLQFLAEQLEQSMQHALTYVSNLTDMTEGAHLLEQQAILELRLEALSKQLDGFKALPNIGQLVTLNGTLPDDMNEIIASWMGAPEISADLGPALAEILILKADAESNSSIAQMQVHFGPASSNLQLPFNSNDLSVTSEGHVLLAAGWQGMREYDLSGLELSSWRPPAQSNGEDDSVMTVAALDDGRAAVGVLWSRLLVLLQCSSADRGWLVERHVAELQSPPWQLSVLGDLVAVALLRQDDQQLWLPGPQLQLVRLSSGQLLYSIDRDYNVESVALTAAGVVTTSYDPVMLSDWGEVDIFDIGDIVDVVDCCSHRGERLWRHELSDDKRVTGVCEAPAGQLYVCLWGRKDRSKDCVRVIDGEDGKNVEDVLASSSHGEKWPRRLSVSRGRQQQQFLAVLSEDEASRLWNKVTVYAAVSSRGSE